MTRIIFVIAALLLNLGVLGSKAQRVNGNRGRQVRQLSFLGNHQSHQNQRWNPFRNSNTRGPIYMIARCQRAKTLTAVLAHLGRE